ncbi:MULTISPECIES: DUF2442 domain-containing protein [unclassified Synechocystis]|uniref:DUF2442 domain-containing protein n=1 Tax=unclassified Synechocystis TaxID=2640012 RepID=UPI0002A573C2|nr:MULTISPECIES: DUF2442 domain-containing protein [unclassified Synechocystis]BAM50345.1 hypothetical protein BEST7613_1414 [Synechocystis sp. PCC 6803] [Bacillus subtilis BEST7613]ALJ66429.1 integron cassette protein [Synechocystis sp. PCC 6803]AVP88278.1 DUF2442 domain-containing protein [Synechocystis sp. IPPAS B-1465]MBD2619303.1 DUF2442 domain-containing protein [Synechocystis sp. FACHB-898]MBD2637657.1 DUF2442 domain-containing protein [Synechocystis sp. FACHB-908]
MSLETLGKNISTVEITHISSHGIWLLSGDNELFLSYDDFPWFKNALVKHIFNVIEPTANHFYWPDLDVDLTLDIIKHPERFPLVCTES